MTGHDAYEAVQRILAELRERYRPDESNPNRGQLGFDYGYQEALAEVSIRAMTLVALDSDERPPRSER